MSKQFSEPRTQRSCVRGSDKPERSQASCA
jgi:hypothetical protein